MNDPKCLLRVFLLTKMYEKYMFMIMKIRSASGNEKRVGKSDSH